MGWLFLEKVYAWGHSDSNYLELLCGKGMENFSMRPFRTTIGLLVELYIHISFFSSTSSPINRNTCHTGQMYQKRD